MIKEILSPIICYILLLWVIYNKRFFKATSISKSILVIGFSLKALSAILFGFLFKSSLITGNDTFMYMHDANIVYSSLFQKIIIRI